MPAGGGVSVRCRFGGGGPGAGSTGSGCVAGGGTFGAENTVGGGAVVVSALCASTRSGGCAGGATGRV